MIRDPRPLKITDAVPADRGQGWWQCMGFDITAKGSVREAVCACGATFRQTQITERWLRLGRFQANAEHRERSSLDRDFADGYAPDMCHACARQWDRHTFPPAPPIPVRQYDDRPVQRARRDRAYSDE